MKNNINEENASMGKTAVISGISLLVMTIIAPLAVSRLSKTSVNIDDIRTGLFIFAVVVILDIIVSIGLYHYLKPADRKLSFWAALFRLVYTAVLAFSLSVLNKAIDFSKNMMIEEAQLSVKLFIDTWDKGLIIFGFHMLLLGYLVYKAEYMPKWLGILIAVGSSGYIIDGAVKIISQGYNLQITMFTFFGEIILLFWLLIKGRKVKIQNYRK